MKTTVVLACLILLLGSGGPAVALDLPPDVLADQYLLEATEALEQRDPQRALKAFGKIEALGTEPPVEFLFFYGKLLVENSPAVDGVRKGRALLKQFVINVGKASEHYRPTLKLLSVAAGKIEAAMLLENLKQQMVTVQGGTFTMGCTEEQSSCDDDEEPVRQVQVNSFRISTYEVTQDLWEAVMGKNPSYFKNCPRCPVEEVSWDDTQAFLQKLNALTGERYRLPTEAEWEYTARGGQQSRGYQHAGSDDVDAVAWHRWNSGNKTHPVGQKQPNELGLYDMSGNLWEWGQDCWYDSYLGAPSDGSAWKIGNCARRVVRGGSWDFGPWSLRSANRSGYDSGYRSSNVGFRIAQTLTS